VPGAVVRDVGERQALRRRLKRFYRQFNGADWAACFGLIDPRLVEQGRVNLASYSKSMQAFKDAYGTVQLSWTRVSLRLELKGHDALHIVQLGGQFSVMRWQNAAEYYLEGIELRYYVEEEYNNS
jgi:hypothetical protein